MLPRTITQLATRSAVRLPVPSACLSVRSSVLSRSSRSSTAFASACAASSSFHSSSMRSAPREKPKPIAGVPINDVTTADDADSDLTLGEAAKRKPGETSDSFAELKISDILANKAQYGNSLFTVKASDNIATALQAMNHFNIGAILVSSDDDSKCLVGIFSTRDFVKAASDSGLVDLKQTAVQDLMSREPVFAYSDASALDSLNQMNAGGFRHLPVRDRATNKPIGLVSIGDLVRTALASYKDKNAFLEDMIGGKYPA